MRTSGNEELLSAFVAAIFPDLPEPMVEQSDPAPLARSIATAFEFVVQTVPPPVQAYRGAPGLHVAAHNPVDEEVTVVQTHTPHVPFIFESLKNYFQQQGAARLLGHPSVVHGQRQWERIVQVGDAAGDGARELYCQFRIERQESPERLRRIEHQMHALLKAVFLAVEDFPAMRRADSGPRIEAADPARRRLRTRMRRPASSGLLQDNFVLMGVLQLSDAPGGGLEPSWTHTAWACFTIRTCCRWCSRG